MLFLLSIVFGLIINYITGGLEFNSSLCTFAGIFLIMPFLLKFSVKELFNYKESKEFIGKSIIINFFINIFIFIGIGYLIIGTEKLLYGLVLLGMLSGGGLLLSWISRTNGSTKMGFQIFLINFIIFNILFIPLSLSIESKFGDNNINNTQLQQNIKKNNYNFINNNNIELSKIDKKENKNKCVISNLTGDKYSCFSDNGGVSPIVAFIVLILLPFILSRFILLIKPLKLFLLKYIKKISTISTFLLITYIFTLKDLHGLFTIDIEIVFRIGISVILSYIIIYFYNYKILLKSNKKMEDISFFWLGTTRFITLGLIFSFIYSYYLGIEIMLIFIFAYIIQILLSIVYSEKIKKEIINK